MKRITFAIISLIAFSTISCFAEKIKGNGNIITKEIQVADYKQIKVGQGIETGGNSFFGKNQSPQVNYTQKGGKSGLKITIDENLLSELKFNSNGDVLQIETERGTRINPSKLIIETHSSELNRGIRGHRFLSAQFPLRRKPGNQCFRSKRCLSGKTDTHN